jgi:nuclear cap-binding protein subunit 1
MQEDADAEPSPAAPWAGDAVAETAAALVTWCRQQGSAMRTAMQQQQLRPDQVAWGSGG